MIGKEIHYYKILEKLGEGVVYKAQDTKLDRTVALKFLPTHSLGSDDDRKRFETEAKAAAALNHNNIATVYEINNHEGDTFIAMEFVEGDTLEDKIKKAPLKIKDAMKIAKQVADGLAAAHEKGIYHRDIKGSNVMITPKGVVKIMDFGLAKMSSATMVTKAGITLGTVGYMSPEQSKGEVVDH
jgi:serine/threonine protein kinase